MAAERLPLPPRRTEWITLPDVADKLDVSISKVHQMIRDGKLLAVRRDGIRVVPAELVANSTVLKHLPGVLTLLRDAGYNDEEALRWLYTPDRDTRRQRRPAAWAARGPARSSGAPRRSGSDRRMRHLAYLVGARRVPGRRALAGAGAARSTCCAGGAGCC